MSEPNTVEERDIFESRRAFIIRYVLEHPDCTKADVIRYMKGRSAVRTTHAIIMSLIKEGKLKVQKKHIQTHLLNLNQGNDFIKIYIQIYGLQSFTTQAREYVHRFHLGDYKNYRTKPPLRYDGTTGFENSFRQFFNIMSQIIYKQIAMISREQDNRSADWRLLDSEIKHVFYNLGFYDWDKNTTREVIDFCFGNIKQYIQILNKQRDKLKKTMEGEEIDRLNLDLEFGNRLIGYVEKLKSENSHIY